MTEKVGWSCKRFRFPFFFFSFWILNLFNYFGAWKSTDFNWGGGPHTCESGDVVKGGSLARFFLYVWVKCEQVNNFFLFWSVFSNYGFQLIRLMTRDSLTTTDCPGRLGLALVAHSPNSTFFFLIIYFKIFNYSLKTCWLECIAFTMHLIHDMSIKI